MITFELYTNVKNSEYASKIGTNVVSASMLDGIVSNGQIRGYWQYGNEQELIQVLGEMKDVLIKKGMKILVDITSVVTAEKIIKAHRNISDSIIRGQVVSRVIDKGIHADSKTHHELTRFLISIYDYENAYSFCKYSLQIYQHCLDLLADYVCICIKKGEVDEVCELIVFFEECVKFENWDKYVYEVIFLWYVEKIHSDWMKRMSFFASAYRIARKRQEFYKYDEIGYCWEAELLIKQNRIEEAERKLKEWILEPIEPEIDYKNMLICPRCCRLLLELLQMRNDYEMIIKVALRGMEGNQDKNSIAYFDKQGQLAMQYVRIKEEKEKEYTKIAGGLKPWMMR